MSDVLNNFLILFKSNAKETQKDILSLYDTTGKAQNKLEDADKMAKSLADSLMRVGLQGIAAFTTFEGIKKGITDAVNFNAALEKTHQLTGANADQLAVWDATFSQFGSQSGEFIGWFEDYSLNLQKAGMSSKDVLNNLRDFSKLLHDLPDDEARQRFAIYSAQTGMPQDFFLTLRQGPELLDKILEKEAAVVNTTDETAKAGLRAESAWKDFSNESRSAFTSLLPFAELFLFVLKQIAAGARLVADIFTLSGWKDLQKTGTFKAVVDLATINGWKELITNTFGGGASAGTSTASATVSSIGASSLGGNSEVNKALVRATKGSGGLDSALVMDPKTLQVSALSAASSAISNADNSPFNSSSIPGGGQTSVNVGTVVVNTQATDAKGIANDIQKSLSEQLSFLGANSNDGIEK